MSGTDNLLGDASVARGPVGVVDLYLELILGNRSAGCELGQKRLNAWGSLGGRGAGLVAEPQLGGPCSAPLL